MPWCKVEEENTKLLENRAKSELDKNTFKSLSAGNRNLKERFENKYLELKHIKAKLESVKKDVASIALRAWKAENKEKNEEFAKKKVDLEKIVTELNDYKKAKLAEERKQMLKKRKEIKRANQKLEKEKIILMAEGINMVQRKN